MLKLRERDIARQIGDLLELDGWRLLWCEPMSRRDLGKGFGERGMADLLAIRYIGGSCKTIPGKATAEILWCEFKAPGKKAAPHQRTWHEAERARGALTLIAGEDFACSTEGFMAWYRASGLNRGRV